MFWGSWLAVNVVACMIILRRQRRKAGLFESLLFLCQLPAYLACAGFMRPSACEPPLPIMATLTAETREANRM